MDRSLSVLSLQFSFFFSVASFRKKKVLNTVILPLNDRFTYLFCAMLIKNRFLSWGNPISYISKSLLLNSFKNTSSVSDLQEACELVSVSRVCYVVSKWNVYKVWYEPLLSFFKWGKMLQAIEGTSFWVTVIKF